MITKIQSAYDKSLDWVLSQWFRFWQWQTRVLAVEAALPQEVVDGIESLIRDNETLLDDSRLLLEMNGALGAERADLLAENNRLDSDNAYLRPRNATLAAENAVLQDENERLRAEGHVTGPDRPNAQKLTKREVNDIREMKRAGYKQKVLAEIFDVNPATISRIVRGQYYGKASA